MSHFEEFLKGMAAVHGSMDGAGLNAKDFPPLSSKSSKTSPNSSTVGSLPLAGQSMSGSPNMDGSSSKLGDSIPVKANIILHAAAKPDSSDSEMKSS